MQPEVLFDDLTCSEQVFDLSFHPRERSLLAAALIDGKVDLWTCALHDRESDSCLRDGNTLAGGEEEGAGHRLVYQNSRHLSSCRGVAFNDTGCSLYSISSDKSMQGLDVGSGRELFYFPLAHDSPLNKLVTLSEHTFATGDDSGEVRLWDIRCGDECSMRWHVHEDFVSGLSFDRARSCLLSVSGDSTLGVYDLRSSQVVHRSDEQESELQCVAVIKGGSKVLCGTQDGVILIFSWDRWGDCSDRYPGQTEPVDCLWKVDESTVVTGSSDGIVRVVSIQPNRVLGVLGDHDDFPVEGMGSNSDRRVLASYSHDEVVRFWDVSMFADDDDDGDDGADMAIDESCPSGLVRDRTKRSVPVVDEDDDEDDDGVDEEEWEDVDMEHSDDSQLEDDDDEEEIGEGGDSDSEDDDQRQHQQQRGRRLLPSANEKFFADL